MFDWLEIIRKLKAEGLTQEQIGAKIGWTRVNINHHLILLNKIDTEFLKLAIQYQKGRVSENDTNVSFNFTEGWFRESGLYQLYQCLSDIDKQLREERKQKIFEMYLACYTQEQIAEVVEYSEQSVKREIDTFQQINDSGKTLETPQTETDQEKPALDRKQQLYATFQEETFEPPLYNIWNQSKQDVAVDSHFGAFPEIYLEILHTLFIVTVLL
ncbi:MAG: helix-turn-helix domain-containing protein [Desulfobacterales bacterium]|nr:helix-turn-helix domain-containing protein [Desulfobacterales bacterium]